MVDKIKIAGVEFAGTGGYHLKSIKGLGASTKYPKSSILYMHGSDIGDAYFNNKQFAIELKIIGSDVPDLLDKRHALFSVLSSIDESEKIEVCFYLSNGIVVKGSGVLKEFIGDVDHTQYIDTDVSLIFEMEKPYFISDTSYRVIVGVTEEGGADVPMAIPLDMSGDTSEGVNVGNAGNIFVFPEIYLHGQLTSPILENLTTGQTLSIAATISTGYYYVDTFMRTVVTDAGVNKRDKMTGDFIRIAVGDNNFRLRTSGIDTGYAEIIYHFGYVSF